MTYTIRILFVDNRFEVDVCCRTVECPVNQQNKLKFGYYSRVHTYALFVKKWVDGEP